MLSSKGRKSSEKCKNAFTIIWTERTPLLRVYFSHFIVKQGTVVKDICYRLVAQFLFCLFSKSGLVYYENASWSFRKQRPCANVFIIIKYQEVFSYRFTNTLFVSFQQAIAFWCKKIQRYLLRGVLLWNVFCKVWIKFLKNIWK